MPADMFRYRSMGIADLQINSMRPAGAMGESFPRGMFNNVVASTTSWTSGTMFMVGIPLWSGQVITNLNMVVAAVGTGAATNSWMALYNNASPPALLRQTVNGTTTLWAAGVKTMALTSTYTTTYSGLHYIAFMQTWATTTPTLYGMNTAGNVAPVSTAPLLHLITTNTALTTTAPATATVSAATVTRPYAYAS